MGHIYCNNCRKRGHMSRKCPLPVLSYGIICFRKMRELKFLLIRRKDSLGFVEFIRGKYEYDIKYLQNIVNEMTIKEKKLIMTESFDFLWKYLWIGCNSFIHSFEKERKKSQKKFYRLREGIMIDDNELSIKMLIENSNTSWEEPEWGFPKGRRNLKESELNCAVREFFEETGYKNNEYNILAGVPCFEEEFIGSNNIHYKHIYYLGKCNSVRTPFINTESVHQVSEVSSIGWFTIDQCLSLIRPYNYEKKNVLMEAYNKIEKIYSENKYCLCENILSRSI